MAATLHRSLLARSCACNLPCTGLRRLRQSSFVCLRSTAGVAQQDSQARQHLEAIRAEFQRQSLKYDRDFNKRNSNKEWIASWILSKMPLQRSDHVLDVACGTGLHSRSIAAHVASVTGLDTTSGMLAQAKDLSAKEGLQNVTWMLGEAEALPHEDGQFDVVTCRLAVHHFFQPESQISEMVRVARRGGHVAIVDLVSPEDPEAASMYNHLETLRDPTHTRALPLSELRSMMAAAAPGATFADRSASETPVLESPVPLEGWMDHGNCVPEENKRQIREAVTAELSGGPRTGMQPWLGEDGTVYFLHRYAVMVMQV